MKNRWIDAIKIGKRIRQNAARLVCMIEEQEAENLRLRALVKKLQAGNRVEALAAARQCYRDGRFAGTPIGNAMLEQWPWLKTPSGEEEQNGS